MSEESETTKQGNDTPRKQISHSNFSRESINAITDKFTYKGTVYYNLEWSDSTNTWEPQKDIPCVDMIEHYKKKPPTHTKEKDLVLGLIPDEKLNFLIRPKNETGAVIFPSEIANVKYPQAVIEFYQNTIKWNSPPS